MSLRSISIIFGDLLGCRRQGAAATEAAMFQPVTALGGFGLLCCSVKSPAGSCDQSSGEAKARGNMLRACVGFLIVLLLSPAAYGQKGPERLWTRTGPINTKYDWGRPPDSVVADVIMRVHQGRLDHLTFDFTYKKDISFRGSFDYIFDLSVRTPLGRAAVYAFASRERFGPLPAIEAVSGFRGSFVIDVTVSAFEENDLPAIAVAYSKGLLTAVAEERRRPHRSRCRDYENVRCWYNSVVLTFQVPDYERLTGVGQVIIRWNQQEHVLPISFDHLW